MCCGCWKEDGAPTINTPNVLALAALFADDKTDHFGALHIVVDDDNLDDESLEWCKANTTDRWTDADERFYQLAKAMTHDERVAASGLYHGCWSLSKQEAI